MISIVITCLLVTTAVASMLYALLYKKVRAYSIFFFIFFPSIFILLISGAFLHLPVFAYYLPALVTPVLTFFLFFGKKRLPLAVFYTVNLSALLIIVYVFILALYFFNNYMGPPFPLGESPSLVMSQVLRYAVVWFVLPFDSIWLLVYALSKMRQRGK